MSRLLRPIALLLLGVLAARAEEPSGEERVRAILEKVVCASFTASVSDGPQLAESLQTALRGAPGGESLNILWLPADAALPGTPIALDLKGLRAHELLSTACRKAGIFWGLRNGNVVLDRAPVPGTLWMAVEMANFSPFTFGARERATLDPASIEADARLADIFRGFLQGKALRPGEDLLAHVEPILSRVMLTTSEEYFPRLRDVVRTLGWGPHQIGITSTWVAYPAATIEKALSAATRPALSQEELMNLYAGPDKKILYSQSVVSMSGVNAVTESVDEIIYPTQFDGSFVEILGFRDQRCTPVNVVIPGAFETRQVGAILNVTPTIDPDNETTNLVLLPEIAELVDWQIYGYQTQPPPGAPVVPGSHMPQPVFRSNNITTTVQLRDGSTLVLSGGRNPKSGDYLYCYITAKLLDTAGKPLR